jgi:2',3'-cyclic-nucleotide 2'-phosphodiesterase (5'-nucleotidase family)
MATVSKKKSRVVMAAAAVLVLLLLGYVLLRPGLASRSGAAQPPEVFSIFYTCDTQGYMEPCGCTSGMAGGISRRCAFLMRNAPRDYLLVDAGDVTAGPREWEMLELEYILKGYELMGYHAVNIGHRELSLGREGLQRIQRDYGRFISANVLDSHGVPVAAPYVVAELSNGYRCGILGVVDDRVEPDQIGAGLRLVPPTEAVAKYLPELKRKADFIVLLAFMDEPQMQALAAHFFEIDVIVGGEVRQATTDPVLENRSAIVFNTDKGKNVGRLDIRRQNDGSWQYAGSMTVLEEFMEKDARVTALVEQYKEQLKARDFRPIKDDEEGLSSITAVRSKTADRYVGPESCRECHKAGYEIWLKSKHARAFETLEQQGHQYNPRCLACHTVGYMASDGYVNEELTGHLKNVSCEACHGRGDHHNKIMAGQNLDGTKALMKAPSCLDCHDQENSPHFDATAYWERIVHGKE